MATNGRGLQSRHVCAVACRVAQILSRPRMQLELCPFTHDCADLRRSHRTDVNRLSPRSPNGECPMHLEFHALARHTICACILFYVKRATAHFVLVSSRYFIKYIGLFCYKKKDTKLFLKVYLIFKKGHLDGRNFKILFKLFKIIKQYFIYKYFISGTVLLNISYNYFYLFT